jgi:hypothetical protein
MKHAVLMGLVFLLVGCAYPWERYYASCVRSGTPDHECYRQAEEMRLQNVRVLLDYNRSLSSPEPARTDATCVTEPTGGGSFKTRCY